MRVKQLEKDVRHLILVETKKRSIRLDRLVRLVREELGADSGAVHYIIWELVFSKKLFIKLHKRADKYPVIIHWRNADNGE